MNYVKIYSGQQMPQVGLGLWQVDDPIKFDESVENALNLGYRHFDIAYTYKNEAQLGAVLTKWIMAEKVKREDLFISTKLPQIGMEGSRVEKFLTLSLNALQMTYVDVYLIHFPVGFQYVTDTQTDPKGKDGQTLIDYSTDLKAIWRAMEAQVDAGRTKVIGLSNFNAEQVQRIWNFARIKPGVLQVELNAYFQQNDLLDLCKKLNIVVVGYGNLGRDLECPAVLTDPVVLTMATKYTKTPAQILLRFLIQRGIVCIPKTTVVELQKQNIEVFDFEVDEEDMVKMRALDQGESARSFTMAFFKGAKLHAEFPFKRDATKICQVSTDITMHHETDTAEDSKPTKRPKLNSD